MRESQSGVFGGELACFQSPRPEMKAEQGQLSISPIMYAHPRPPPCFLEAIFWNRRCATAVIDRIAVIKRGVGFSFLPPRNERVGGYQQSIFPPFRQVVDAREVPCGEIHRGPGAGLRLDPAAQRKHAGIGPMGVRIPVTCPRSPAERSEPTTEGQSREVCATKIAQTTRVRAAMLPSTGHCS